MAGSRQITDDALAVRFRALPAILLKRLFTMILTLIGVSVLVFALAWYAPGLAGTLGEGELEPMARTPLARTTGSANPHGFWASYRNWWIRALWEPVDLTMWVEDDGLRPVLHVRASPDDLLVYRRDGRWWHFTLADRPRSKPWKPTDPLRARTIGSDTLALAAHAGIDSDTAAIQVAGEFSAALDAPPNPASLQPARTSAHLFRPTLGRSLTTYRPVLDELHEHAWPTFLLGATALLVVHLIAIPCGMIMGVRRGTRLDQSLDGVLLLLWSFPVVLAGTLMIGSLTHGGQGFNWFPTGGLPLGGATPLRESILHMLLPVACLTYPSLAYVARQARSATARSTSAEFIRTARAKGCGSVRLILRHLLPNAAVSLIAVWAVLVPWLMAGSVIVEKLFSINGLGMLAFRAVQNRDTDVILALAILSAFISMLTNLIADALTALADPRTLA